jgi:tetratricopeptide (TPR) repeat protein
VLALFLAFGFAARVAVQAETVPVGEKVYLPKVIPAGPGAYCSRNLTDDFLRWNRRTIVEAYRTVGRHNAAWDDQAIAFLESYARLVSNCPDVPSRAEYLETVQPLIKAGCTDPMVLSAIGDILHKNDRLAEAQDYFGRAVAGFKEVPYPKAQVRRAYTRLATFAYNDETQYGKRPSPSFAERFAQLNEVITQSLTDGSFVDGEQRMLWKNVSWEVAKWYRRNPRPLYDAVFAQPGVDPWFENLVAGWYHIQKAWQARGNDWANNVTEEGWRGFGEHLAKAREHLSRAYALHPNFPEPAGYMMTVAMGQGDAPEENVRTWFDRAVAAQLDYRPAYSSLLWAMRPRWGGSHEAMYRFGLECLETGRFDTDVPRTLLKAVEDIAFDEGWEPVWRVRGVYDNLVKLCDGMTAARPEAARWWKTARPLIAWKCGRYADAADMLEKLGSDADPACLTEFKTDLTRVRREASLAANPLASEVRRATDAYGTTPPEQLLPVFEDLLTRASDPMVAAACREYVVALRKDLELAKGDWVDVMPGPDLAGWERLRGEWAVEADGALRSVVEMRRGTMLLLRNRFGGNYEIRGEIELPPVSHDPEGGVVVAYKELDEPRWAFVRVRQPRSSVFIGTVPSAKNERSFTGDVFEKNTFLIQVWEGRMKVVVNNETVIASYEITDEGSLQTPCRVGLGAGAGLNQGMFARYRKVQLQLLKEAPPGLSSPSPSAGGATGRPPGGAQESGTGDKETPSLTE